MRQQEILGGTFNLLDGNFIPLVGLGTSPKTWLTGWKWSQEEMDAAIDAALESGYRLFDTAHFYGNDEVLSRAFKTLLPKHNLKREDIFVTSKAEIMIPDLKAKAREVLERSIEAFEYLNLVLVHYPKYWHRVEDDSPENPMHRLELYRVLEEYKEKGQILSLGVSNFEPRHIEELKAKVKYPPVVNQCEFHPHLCRPELLNYCRENGIFYQAHTSLAKHNQELYNHPIVKDLLKKYACSAEHLLLAFAHRQSVGVIPKSANPERIRENITFLRINLLDEDVKKLSRLDKGYARRYTNCNQWDVL